MLRSLLALVVAGCGRVAFEPLAGADAAPDGSGAGLAAYYSCDGEPTADATAQHPGTCVGPCPTSTPGVVGSACHFSGTSLVSVASAPDLETGTVSVAAWVRRQSNDQTQNIVSKVVGPLNSNTWQLVSEGGGLTYCLTNSTGGGLCNGGGTEADLPLDTWVHVAIVVDASDYRAYVGGTEVGNGSLGLGYDSGALVFGGDIDTAVPNHFLTGDLDEIRIYTRALSAAEVTALATP